MAVLTGMAGMAGMIGISGVAVMTGMKAHLKYFQADLDTKSLCIMTSWKQVRGWGALFLSLSWMGAYLSFKVMLIAKN